MQKVKNTGFANIEIILAAVILVALGFIAYFVFNRSSPQHQNTPTSNNATSSTTSQGTISIANWKTFSNNFVSFKYPPSWTATNQDSAYSNDIAAKIDSSFLMPTIDLTDLTKEFGPITSLDVQFTVSKLFDPTSLQVVTNPSDSLRNCQNLNICYVNQIIPLTLNGGDNLKLIVSAGQENNSFNITDSQSVSTGTSNYTYGMTIANVPYTISGGVNIVFKGDSGSCTTTSPYGCGSYTGLNYPQYLNSIKDITEYENTNNFKEMLLSLSTVTFH